MNVPSPPKSTNRDCGIPKNMSLFFSSEQLSWMAVYTTLLSFPHTKGHDVRTCCSDILLPQNHVLLTQGDMCQGRKLWTSFRRVGRLSVDCRPTRWQLFSESIIGCVGSASVVRRWCVSGVSTTFSFYSLRRWIKPNLYVVFYHFD